ncbi:hypothetical protein H9643_19075 [Ochrobactrum sp. Sa2BUA5]|nr:hypothetical protein [Ochrobactrum gallinarum]
MTLIDRLSKMEGPDREVDAILWCLDNKLTFKKKLHHTYNGYPRFYSFRTAEKGTVGIGLVPKYTASVDAAIALAERVLPGANVLIGWGQTKETKPWARIGVIPSHDATGFNLATALCIAILRAKETSNAE